MERNGKEVEVKVLLTDCRFIREKILSLGFKVGIERCLEDNWVLDFPDQSLRQKRSLFRLREYDGKTILTYKGPSELSKYFKIREELETGIHDGPDFLRIMEKLGMQLSFRYQKYRTEFCGAENSLIREVLVTLDETPIGDYLEIEGGEEAILEVASRLGFSPADFITESYIALYLKKNPGTPEMRMVF